MIIYYTYICVPGWRAADEKSDEYSDFVAHAFEQSGIVGPDEATYELGDISIHTTAVFHAAGPNTLTQVFILSPSACASPTST